MTCSVVKGDTPLTIIWRKDGHSLDPTQRIQVNQVDQYNSLLVIDSLQADHTGNYSCVVRNSAAEVEGTQGLLVNGNVLRHRSHIDFVLLDQITKPVLLSFSYKYFYVDFFLVFFYLIFQYLPLLSLFPFKTVWLRVCELELCAVYHVVIHQLHFVGLRTVSRYPQC